MSLVSTPLEIVPGGSDDLHDAEIYGYRGSLSVLVAEVFEADEANRIVKCVNSHEALVEALREARETIAIGLETESPDEAEWSQNDRKLVAKIDAALSKADT